MKIIWDFSDADIKKVIDFVNEYKSPFVENRISRNIHRNDVLIDKDVILKTMLMSLLSSEHNADPDNNLHMFLRKKPFLLADKFLAYEDEIEDFVREVLVSHGMKRNFNKIPGYFTLNYLHLVASNWEIKTELEECSRNDLTKSEERTLADKIDQNFKGFGSKQARYFLQSLGLTKYELPISSQVTAWLKELGFPVLFTPIALQDKSCYHFVSDGIQLLCEQAKIYPCVLEAAIFSSHTKHNA